MTKGKPISSSNQELSLENVWWLYNTSNKQYLVAYYNEKQNAGLQELSLLQCALLYGSSPAEIGEKPEDDAVQPESHSTSMPTIPPKYKGKHEPFLTYKCSMYCLNKLDFVRKRLKIFREIRNMRKISDHRNVIKLQGVLELVQDSKCTLFLVMELANGGELFDRIKIDYGTLESTARLYFKQLLQGVRHCHQGF